MIDEGSDEQGNGRIHIVSAPEIDAREAVSLALAENRIAVMGMERKEKSLEDIFLELTGDGESEPEARGGDSADHAGNGKTEEEK